MSQYNQFRFEYSSGVLKYGAGCVGDLSEELERQGFQSGLVVSGSTVGTTSEVVDPVIDGLDKELAGVFAETTPGKRLETAYKGLEAMEDNDADVLVSLGGGSSLDVAKVISVLAVDDRDPKAVGQELAETGSIFHHPVRYHLSSLSPPRWPVPTYLSWQA